MAQAKLIAVGVAGAVSKKASRAFQRLDRKIRDARSKLKPGGGADLASQIHRRTKGLFDSMTRPFQK